MQKLMMLNTSQAVGSLLNSLVTRLKEARSKIIVTE